MPEANRKQLKIKFFVRVMCVNLENESRMKQEVSFLKRSAAVFYVLLYATIASVQSDNVFYKKCTDINCCYQFVLYSLQTKMKTCSHLE